jgi:hypothetical protein
VVGLEDASGNPLSWRLVLGQVVGVHVDDRYIRQGRIDAAAMRPLARCGYDDYAVLDKVPGPSASAPVVKENQRRVFSSTFADIEVETVGMKSFTLRGHAEFPDGVVRSLACFATSSLLMQPIPGAAANTVPSTIARRRIDRIQALPGQTRLLLVANWRSLAPISNRGFMANSIKLRTASRSTARMSSSILAHS